MHMHTRRVPFGAIDNLSLYGRIHNNISIYIYTHAHVPTEAIYTSPGR